MVVVVRRSVKKFKRRSEVQCNLSDLSFHKGGAIIHLLIIWPRKIESGKSKCSKSKTLAKCNAKW